jgi:hypothetical protein
VKAILRLLFPAVIQEGFFFDIDVVTNFIPSEMTYIYGSDDAFDSDFDHYVDLSRYGNR